MNLTETVAAAVGAPDEPSAALALAYATRIDDATHITLAMAKALSTIRDACETADDPDAALDALAKIRAELSAVTVLADLGPKLLSALDALTLTPKARAAITRRLDDTNTAAPNALDRLRDRHDSRHLRATG